MSSKLILGALSNEEASSTPNNRVTELGRLRSHIKIEIHTYEGAALFSGVKRESDQDGTDDNGQKKKFTPHNLTMLAQSMMILEGDIRLDNPYADFWFDSIWTAITEFREELKTKKQSLISYMEDRVPENFTSSESFSVKPIIYQVRSGSQLYYQFLYAVLEIDSFIRLVMLASHVALLSPSARTTYIRDVMRGCRALISRAASYRHTPVTRDDVSANNEKARMAAERYESIGISPSIGHMRGETRHEFAPEIHNVAERKSNPADAYIEPEIVKETAAEEA
ncbi:TPA: TIGR03761 family integrating conjugative element protein [Aeromonas hydrophila subsp. hydrophila]|uniref:PFL_4669 family integrating conjugative element protein n=1 Tax=Aeromonas caviae TaxID=648 RepID=UPI00292779F9|nr:TIGR03761 family integrating conjugative element protein [Aeromonas caviae]MDX7766104.1 TIGR03761 family integrating conjugative element protein [Aeromonas caviae]HEB5079046.1 TIGR03761 family integrating conjugative element protein [Aeromonas hydrophila subsp. hydrophila]